MRPRHLRPQVVTVRPLIDQADDANAFGDAPAVSGDARDDAFEVLMTISWNRNDFSNGTLGLENTKAATAILWKRDLARPGRTDYEPGSNDIIETATAKLFVTGVEPIAQLRVGLGQRAGGFQGWRLTLSDRNPEQRAATSYD